MSRRAFCFALFGRASCFSAFLSGCHSGPRAFLGFSLNLWGLSLARPFRGPFLGTRGGKGFPVLLLPCFSFSPFVLFCGYTFSRKARPVISRRPAAGDLARPLAQVRARGLPYLGRRVGPLLFCDFVGLFVSQRVTGTLGRPASRAFCLGRGRFSCPLTGPFSQCTFCSRPRCFFFSLFFVCLRGRLPNWIA